MQPQAREKAEKEGFEVSVAKTSFKANTKALAENEGEGLAKVIYIIPFLQFLVVWYSMLMICFYFCHLWYCCKLSHCWKIQFFCMLTYFIVFVQLIYRPDNGEILGVHIFGLHAADLIHEASNAIAMGNRIQV